VVPIDELCGSDTEDPSISEDFLERDQAPKQSRKHGGTKSDADKKDDNGLNIDRRNKVNESENSGSNADSPKKTKTSQKNRPKPNKSALQDFTTPASEPSNNEKTRSSTLNAGPNGSSMTENKGSTKDSVESKLESCVASKSAQSTNDDAGKRGRRVSFNDEVEVKFFDGIVPSPD